MIVFEPCYDPSYKGSFISSSFSCRKSKPLGMVYQKFEWLLKFRHHHKTNSTETKRRKKSCKDFTL